MSSRSLRSLAAAGLAAACALAAAPVASAAVTVPPDVSAALATFTTDPQGAMTTWVDWAEDQPMVTALTAPNGRTDCRMDAAGVSRCVNYSPNPSNAKKPASKKWVRDGVTYTLANEKTQVFKYKGKWVRNDLGADMNPFTNTSQFYSYDYWLPWSTPGLPVDASVDTNGWYSVQVQNPKAGDDQYPVTMVLVSPDGLKAQFWQQYEDGRIAVKETITLRDVPSIKVPQSTKQRI